MQGGLVVVKNKKVISQVAFPIAGLLSNLPADELSIQLRMLTKAAQAINCTLDEPFQQLSFLALPVIPHLKLTDMGLFDVDVFQHIKE
jgi:adenine deaminase